MGTPIHHWCKKIIIYTSIGEGILICDRSTQWPIKHYLSTHYQIYPHTTNAYQAMRRYRESIHAYA